MSEIAMIAANIGKRAVIENDSKSIYKEDLRSSTAVMILSPNHLGTRLCLLLNKACLIHFQIRRRKTGLGSYRFLGEEAAVSQKSI